MTTSDSFSGTHGGLEEGTLAYLSALGTFMKSATTSLSELGKFLITGTTFWGGVDLSYVTLFDELNR